MAEERTLLLSHEVPQNDGSGYGTRGRESRRESHNSIQKTNSVKIAKHITLIQAIWIMVGTVAGTGIFVSPTGVTQQVGSVGTTLIMWTVSGLFSLLCALCYAELGTALPMAGGDYAYINYVLGRVPAFLCLWLMVVLLGPCAISISGRTVAAYLNTLLELECYNSLTIVICIWITLTAACMNCRSLRWSAKLVTIFSVGKVLALGVIIVAGVVLLCQGQTGSLSDPFASSVTSPTSILLGFLPAFFTFGGWDSINALAEEMINPKRDLPIAAVVSLTFVTSIYLLVNIAYFTVITPMEFIKSDAVAVLFASKVMPSAVFLVPLFVIISSAGSILNLFLVCPRWAFAGGRDDAIPKILSYIHLKNLTPVPSILLTAGLGCLFSLALFFDLQDLLNITSMIGQIKVILALIALLILKQREPDKRSTITVPTILVVFAILVLILVTLVPLWQSPEVAFTALGIFFLGLPLYYLKEYIGTWDSCKNASESITKNIQLLLNVIPTSRPTLDESISKQQ